MTARLIDGKAIAESIKGELRGRVEALAAGGVQPGLATVLVGDDPASRVYVGMKQKMCAELGILSVPHPLPESTSREELLKLVDKLNNDDKIHGILVQLPLPGQIDEKTVIEAISPAKDVDGFHPVSLGRLVIGMDGFRPCTPAGIQELLVRSGVDLAGKEVVIVGRSNIVGKPLANILIQKADGANATVTVAHSRTRDLPAVIRRADVLVAAMGKAEFIRADWVKPGAVVIDVGTNRVDDPGKKRGYRLTGDVKFDEVREVASLITPVPGGVGPMTIIMLMTNTVISAERRAGA
ncbi:MAG: bifunctional methylenetetrahydrofolate dehydrogenase/methenyltetrahydrofolate cyclohydrolase FolD [Candidatus Glassbacteria bacterium]|nr:bifunctional methylenetetrahydrofolate dehydrogenase/methenyltetrahydrofolate cyclohydrolase FolD [Candidatus Glassbacteria bacterium]